MPETQIVDPIEKFRKQKVYAVKMIAFMTLSVILIAVAIGFGLDYLFNTKPWLLIASVVLSFPVTQFVVLKKVKKDISNKF